MVKVCAIYVRKSKRDDNSDSMETQIFMCEEYLKSQFPNCIIKIYDKDYNITGHSTHKRKDFQRMMNDVRSGLINVVAIQRYDRIARNTRDFCNLYYDMEQVGCELVSVSQRIDTSTPYGKKFMYDLASTAELEWALNSERRKDVNNYARVIKKCNLSPKCLPKGYKAERIDGTRRMIKDTEWEPIIYDAIEYLEMSSSKNKTLRYINDKYNKDMSHAFIDTLLRSDFYHGEYKGVTDYCPAYMTKEQHEKLRNRRIKYIRNYSSDKKHFLFTGLLVCPVCGVKMESQSQVNTSGNRYYYYRCYNPYRTGKCTFRGNVNEKDIENSLVTHIGAYIDANRRSKAISIKNNTKVVNLAKYKAEMERLTNAYIKGRVDESYYDAEYNKLQKIITDSQAEEKPEPTHGTESLNKIFNAGWTETYMQLNRENKRTFWQNIISTITINEDKTIKSVKFL